MLFLNREKSTFYSSVNNRKFSILFKLVQFQRSHMFMLGIVFFKTYSVTKSDNFNDCCLKKCIY